MKLRNFLFCCLIVYAPLAKADSPLTSTYFAGNYYEYAVVEKAANGSGLTDEIAVFLLDKTTPIDAKAAAINAIGWSYDGTKNADLWKGHLAKKYATTKEQLQLSKLSADELLCLGYFMAMDDYFHVDDAIHILEMAKNAKPESFTISMILAMTKAQKAMDYDWCQVWKLTSDVLNDKSLKRDMKTASIQVVVDYMILYRSECYY